MKILMCNKFHYILGGTERYLFDTSKGLKDLGHTVMHFSMLHSRNFNSPYSAYFVRGNDFTEPFNKRTSMSIDKAINFVYSFEARKMMNRLIVQHHPDVAHVHNIYHHISSSILHSLRKNRIPVAMTVHDYKLICPNYSLFTGNKVCQRCKGHKYYHAILNRCIKHSFGPSVLAFLEMAFCKALKMYEKNVDVFIAPSRFVREKLIEFGLPESKILHLPHAIDLRRYKPCVGKGEYILYLGSLYYKKGVNLLLEVARKLRAVTFKIAGEGPLRGELQALIARYNLSNVELLGYVPAEKTMDLVSHASLVVFPSLWYEVAGLSIYEACASGKCVVASRIGGIPEIIQDGINGVLCEPGSAEDLCCKVTALLEDPEKAQEIGKNASIMMQKFHDPASHYAALLQIYERLISKGTAH